MELKEDGDRFDELQTRLLDEILISIRDALRAKKLDEDLVQELTGDIGFSVAAIVDGSRVMELDGQNVRPVLTFEEPEGVLLTAGGGSWMHEYVFGALDELDSLADEN